jgi:hypothetical protein
MDLLAGRVVVGHITKLETQELLVKVMLAAQQKHLTKLAVAVAALGKLVVTLLLVLEVEAVMVLPILFLEPQ